MRHILLIILSVSSFCVADDRAKWPPKGTMSVRIYAFEGTPSRGIIVEGKLHHTANPISGIKLTDAQIESISSALNEKTIYEGVGFRCFDPKDGVVFYDENNNVIAAVSVCFTCYRVRMWPQSLWHEVNLVELAKFFAPLRLDGGYRFKDGKPDEFIQHYTEFAERMKRLNANDNSE